MKQQKYFLYLKCLLLLLRVSLVVVEGVDDFNDVPRLSFAAAIGNITEIHRLLRNGDHNVDERDWIGQTALHMAAKFGCISAAELLLQHGANPNARNADYNETPLHCSAKTGNVAIMSLLLRYGADIDAVADGGNVDGGTPLHYATSLANSLQAVRFLVNHGANVNAANHLYNETPLHLAVQHENLAVMRYLVENGANLTSRDWLGNTPLHTAITRTEPQPWIAKYLIDKGAPLELRNADGNTPQQLARMKALPSLMLLLQGNFDKAGNYLLYHQGGAYNNVTLLKQLLTLKTRKSTRKDKAYLLNELSRDDFDRTPLHTAVQFQQYEATQFLLDNGAEVNARQWEGFTPLHFAAKTGNRAIIELLLERGGLINDHDNGDDSSPLMMAVSYGNAFTPSLIRLLEYGASVDGADLIHKAVQEQNIRHIEHLLLAGADVNAKVQPEKETPLSRLLWSDGCYPQIPLLSYLIDRGASLKMRDNFGHTPLHKAIIGRKRGAVINYLLYRGADPNAVDARGCDTPLYLLVRLAVTGDHFVNYGTFANLVSLEGLPDVVRLLVRHGSFVDAVDPCSGRSALDLVKENMDSPISKEIANILSNASHSN